MALSIFFMYVVGLIGLVLFTIAAKKYKFRERDMNECFVSKMLKALGTLLIPSPVIESLLMTVLKD